MKKSLSILCCYALAASLWAQILQPVEAYRYQHYGVRVEDPQNCEGLDDRISEFRYDFEPIDGSLDRMFRCLESRARGFSRHESTITGDTIFVYLRTMTELSNATAVIDGEARGDGENFERATFDLARTTRFRMFGSAHGRIGGDAEVASEVYLDAGFVLQGGADTHVELAFSDQIQGDGALDREFICPPGRYTFAAAATVLSCALSLQQPQQVFADAEVVVRLEVIHCPGDLDGDYDCDVHDLAQLLAHFGLSGDVDRTVGDLDGNRRVEAADLAALLAAFGQPCWP